MLRPFCFSTATTMQFICIHGRSGSGKSTLATALFHDILTHTDQAATLIHLDDFYLTMPNPSDYDLPSSINWTSLMDVLDVMHTGVIATFATADGHSRSYPPADIVILEGIFPVPFVHALISINISIPAPIAWERRVARGNSNPAILREWVDSCYEIHGGITRCTFPLKVDGTSSRTFLHQTCRLFLQNVLSTLPDAKPLSFPIYIPNRVRQALCGSKK